MARRSTSIFDSFRSGGSVGSSLLSDENATLNKLTLNLSRDACALRYFGVARRCRRRSSRDNLVIITPLLITHGIADTSPLSAGELTVLVMQCFDCKLLFVISAIHYS